MCCCNCFNKQVDCPIAGQNKVRRESQNEKDGMKGRVRSVTSQTQDSDTQNGIRVKVMSLGDAHRLIEMG